MCISASELPKISIVTEESYPANYTAEDSDIRGFAADYIKYALNQNDVPFDITIYSWNRAFKIANQDENVIIFPIARTPEREASFHWLHEIMTVSYYIYGLKSREDEFVDTPNFKDYKIGVIAGGITQKLLEERDLTNITLAKDYVQLINLIRKNRVDFIATSSFGILISRGKYPDIYFKPYLKLTNREIKLYYALSRSSSDAVADKLKAILNQHEDKLVIPN